MSLWAEHLKQTCDIPDGLGGTRTVACRARRLAGLGPGNAYWLDWEVLLGERVALGDPVTVTGDTARTVQRLEEVRDVGGAVAGYQVILGHV